MKTKAIDILAKIKQLFADMPPVTPVAPTAPADPNEPTGSIVLNTTDGVEVVVDKLSAGGKATIAGQPAAAGNYTFTDGSSITVDTTGTISMYTAPVVQATPPATIPDPTLDGQQKPPVAAPVIAPAANPAKMSKQFKFADIKQQADMDAIFASFAVGTPEDRIANLEIVCKALMECNYGWEIRQAKENTDKLAAIKVYTDELSTVQAQMKSQKLVIEKQQGIIAQMFSFMQELSEESTSTPPGDQKKSFKFSEQLGGKKKGGLGKFAEAAQKIKEEQEAATAKA